MTDSGLYLLPNLYWKTLETSEVFCRDCVGKLKIVRQITKIVRQFIKILVRNY